MAQFKGFRGLRTYNFVLQNDLRDLEQYLLDLETRVARLTPGEPISLFPPNPGQSNLALHAFTHVTKVDAVTGTDPIDVYHMLWRKRQEIYPDLAAAADISLTVRGSSTAQTGDIVRFYDASARESYAMNNSGLSSFGDATELARVNIKNSGIPQAIAPDDLDSATPVWWMRADDLDGIVAEGNTTSNVPERLTTNTVTAFTEGPAGSAPVTYRDKDGSNHVGGHASVEQRATATGICLSGNAAEGSGSYPTADVRFTGEFTVFIAYSHNGYTGGSALWAIGRGRSYGSNGSGGIAVPVNNADAFAFLATESTAATTIGTDDNFTGNGAKVFIMRRNSANAVKAFCTKNTGLPVEMGPTTVAGTVRFNGLFSGGGATVAGPIVGSAAPRIAEIIVFSGYISDSELLELYQWGAARYGLTALTSGGSGDLIHGYDATPAIVFTVDADGKTGIGVSLDPSIRLHIRDTVEQFRIEYDATHYASFTVDSAGNLTVSDTGTTPTTSFTNPVKITSTTTQLRLAYDADSFTDFTVGSTSHLNITPAESGNVGIEQASPAAKLHITHTAEQLRLDYDGVNYATFSMSPGDFATGTLNIDVFGSAPFVQFLDQVEIKSTGINQLVISYNSGNFASFSVSSSGTLTVNTFGSATFTEFIDPVKIVSTTNPQFTLLQDVSNLVTFFAETDGDLVITPSGSDVGINTSPSASLHVLKTTEQLRLGFDTSNYTSFTVSSAGALTIDSVGPSGTQLVTINDPLVVVNTADGSSPGVDIQGSADSIMLRMTGASGQASDYIRIRNSTTANVFRLTAAGGMIAPTSATAGSSFALISVAERETAGAATPAFLMDISSSVTAEPTLHTRWRNKAGTTIQDLDSTGILYKGPITSASRYWSKNDTATWSGFHTFDFGINIGTLGLIESDAPDGDIAFDLVQTNSMPSGDLFLLRNSADNKHILRIQANGHLILGYGTGLVTGLTNSLMSFAVNDTNGITYNCGVVGIISHGSAGTPSRLLGMGGGAGIISGAGVPSANFIYGSIGVGFSQHNSSSYSSKTLAGVVGHVSHDNTEGDLFPTTPDTSVSAGADLSVAGNWKHVSCLWANALVSAGLKGPALTNKPAISSGVKSTIPEISTSEAWGIYGNSVDELGLTGFGTGGPPTYYAAVAASNVGWMRCPWPRHGTRRTHFYMIPGSISESTGNLFGDVIFDDGAGSRADGLHEYIYDNDGSASTLSRAYILPQLAHNNDATGGAPSLGNVPGVGAGPNASASDGWIKIKIDNGTAYGLLVWMPYWL